MALARIFYVAIESKCMNLGRRLSRIVFKMPEQVSTQSKLDEQAAR